ncbi:hypothetical protein M758_11G055000, partial [Ceratodon purpureus]
IGSAFPKKGWQGSISTGEYPVPVEFWRYRSASDRANRQAAHSAVLSIVDFQTDDTAQHLRSLCTTSFRAFRFNVHFPLRFKGALRF